MLLNRGDGTFRARTTIDRNRALRRSVAIGDLNGDGKPDLVTANASRAVSVLVNRGDGSFQPKLDYRAGRCPHSVAIGDLNGDGKPDLATANHGANTVSVLLNTPGLCTVQNVKATDIAGREADDRARQLPRREDPPRLLEDRQERPGDLAEARIRRGAPGRRQGQSRRQPRKEALVKKLLALASVLVLAGSLGVAALFAASAPSFARAKSYATGRAPASVAIGDLNGDGKPDLATANYAAAEQRLRAPEQGRRQLPGQARLPNRSSGPYSVAIGDLNGDGKPDLATANELRANTVSVLLNRGDGSFQAKLDYATGGRPLLGRDRRPERRRQAGPGDRERDS